MIYESVLKEKQRLETQIELLTQQLKTLPDGKLISSLNGKNCKWYWSDGNKPVYLPKKERRLAEQLAQKKLLTLQLKNAIRENTAIDFYLRHHDPKAFETEVSFTNSSKYKELLMPAFTPLLDEIQNWMNQPYEKNDKFAEQLIHKGYSGNLLRSKSEALIDILLQKNKIPFRYECLLQLDDVFIYPDFTIRHPKTGEFFYWEHFGMMDDLSYCRNYHSKMQIYISNGIIPSIQLITTYETKEHPLDSQWIELIIEHYFL